jgi:glutaredoxin-like protein NrdH
VGGFAFEYNVIMVVPLKPKTLKDYFMITVYSLPSCVQCIQTKKLLVREGFEFSEVMLSEDDVASEKVKALGYASAPVVIAGDKHWSGFRPDMIMSLAK